VLYPGFFSVSIWYFVPAKLQITHSIREIVSLSCFCFLGVGKYKFLKQNLPDGSRFGFAPACGFALSV